MYQNEEYKKTELSQENTAHWNTFLQDVPKIKLT